MQIDLSETAMSQALAGAIELEADQQRRGIPPLKTAAAAAMLVGLIIGEGAESAAQMERALDHLVAFIRLIANDCLSERQAMH
jgi:hypothetical protein